jgi:hypothetical protein
MTIPSAPLHDRARVSAHRFGQAGHNVEMPVGGAGLLTLFRQPDFEKRQIAICDDDRGGGGFASPG